MRRMIHADQPGSGRAGRVPGTKELVVPHTPYIVPYRVKDDTVQILRIYHASRKWSGWTADDYQIKLFREV